MKKIAIHLDIDQDKADAKEAERLVKHCVEFFNQTDMLITKQDHLDLENICQDFNKSADIALMRSSIHNLLAEHCTEETAAV